MHRNGWQRRLAVSFCLLLLILPQVPATAAQEARRGASRARNSRTGVKLVVGIMIDQFRADYLVRFADQFVPGGFRRLLTNGAVFTNAHYIHVPTYTACGHATFMSGATPSSNGIIGNEWYDRATGRRVTSVSDTNVRMLGAMGEGAASASPSRLLGTTLGDELRMQSNGAAKVIGIALKDRSAILPAGKRPNGAFWFNARSGNFISSTYYFEQMPAWAEKFNRDMRPDRFFGMKWDRLLPAEAYSRSQPDDAPYEKTPRGTTFPYTIDGGEAKPGPRFYSQFEATPFANQYTLEFARAAIEGEGLGADDVPDLLTVSLSANDLLGHTYGPYSQEVHDMTLRTDRLLADFFNYLDRRIGLDQVVIALSADHGVAPIPEQVKAMGYGGRIENRPAVAAVEAALTARFGEEKWVHQFLNSNIYFDDAAIERRKAPREEVERTACAALLKIEGIGACFTRTDLVAGATQSSKIAVAVGRGYHPARNGDVVIVPQPYYFFSEGLGTTHGTPYSYDTHVPVILFGAGVVPGMHATDASPADIAPTLAALLRVTRPSNSEGRVLVEALASERQMLK